MIFDTLVITLVESVSNACRRKQVPRVYEPVGYVITDFCNKRAEKRAAAIDLLHGYDYDVRKYSEMLVDSANTILNPFGITDPLQYKLNS